MAKPLALAATAYGEGSGLRGRGEALIDALPYIDDLPAVMRQQVDALIEEEAKRSLKQPQDYLRELPPVPAPTFGGSTVLAAEYERVKKQQQMDPLDTSRFRLDPPPATRRSDLSAWQAALDNANAQLEHQYTRIQNLELLLKYGDKAWRAQAQVDEMSLKQLEAETAALLKAKNELNQARKLSQTLAGQELGKAEEEWLSLLRKNFEIERACAAREDEIEALHRVLERLRAAPAQAASSALPDSAAHANGDAPTAAPAAAQGPGHAGTSQPADSNGVALADGAGPAAGGEDAMVVEAAPVAATPGIHAEGAGNPATQDTDMVGS